MIHLIPDAARLNGRERALAARATAWLLLARVALRVLPFGAVRAALHRIPPRRHPNATAGDCERAVRRAARTLPAARCLAQACAGAALLKREGRGSLLTIHVTVAGGRRLDAHACLISEGVVIAGRGTGMDWPVLMRERIQP